VTAIQYAAARLEARGAKLIGRSHKGSQSLYFRTLDGLNIRISDHAAPRGLRRWLRLYHDLIIPDDATIAEVENLVDRTMDIQLREWIFNCATRKDRHDH
jgi:hypothetical protein